jgi:5-methylthioribose kinase
MEWHMSLPAPPGYRPLDDRSLPSFLAGLPEVSTRLGGGQRDWAVNEVGDGSLNLVFLVEGPEGGVCVKQALPYVRLVGEGWPMTLKRAFFEYRYMRAQERHVGALMPRLYHYDPALYAIVMERLAPHIIMRHGVIDGRRYPAFAEHITDFMARSLFFTSDLAIPAQRKKALTALFCENTELCKITEDLIFTEPYCASERNRWTTPQLDRIAAEFRSDAALKLAISRLKLKFLSQNEALIHGDLHTGSVMVTDEDTRVIDAEFAFVGPMGFDVGAVIANLLLGYFSQEGHSTPADRRSGYEEWLLEVTEEVWNRFVEKFLALWRGHAAGDAYPAALFEDIASREALEEERQRTIRRLYQDTLGFAAAKMIRRILGLAHVIDLERIGDPDRRAVCELRALRLARDLMVNGERYPAIADVTAGARLMRERVLAEL